MVKTLEQSVAAVLDDAKGVAGTAFLFRKDEDYYYWFTCHHVIAALGSLGLGINFTEGKPGVAIDAEYVAESSNPSKDIAVLKTKPDPAMAEFQPIPMGDARIGYNEAEPAKGYGFTPGSVMTFRKGRRFDGTLKPGQEVTTVVHPEDVSAKIEALGNAWNVPNPHAECCVFVLHHAAEPLDPGLSGSPVCVTTKYDDLLCVGMLSQSSTKVHGYGFAIQFHELFSAARTLIPFYPYADCVVLIVAATLSEITPHVSDAHILKKHDLCTIYSEDDRDAWKCMEQDIKELMGYLQRDDRTWQLATVYLDRMEEMEKFIESTPGPLFYILDSCSLTVPELEKVVKMADDQHYHASYLFPRYEARFSYEQRQKLREGLKELMPSVAEKWWVRPRVDECMTLDDFKKKFWELLEKTVEVSAVLIPNGPMERLTLPAPKGGRAMGSLPGFMPRETQ